MVVGIKLISLCRGAIGIRSVKVYNRFYLQKESREIVSANQTIMRAWSEGEFFRIQRLVRQLLLGLGASRSLMRTSLWDTVFDHIISSAGDRFQADDQASLHGVDNCETSVTPKDWLLLYRWLLSSGMFRTALQARRHAVLAITKNTYWNWVFRPKLLLGALAEQGRESETGSLWHNSAISFLCHLGFRRMITRLPLYLPSRPADKPCYAKNNQDFAFSYLVSGKRIAVLGPAPVKVTEVIDELKTFDVVVFLNATISKYHEYWSLANADNLNIVSYYNNAGGKRLSGTDTVRELRHLAFVVMKNAAHIDRIMETDIPVRTMSCRNNFRLNGTFNMIPNVVFDLLAFRPEVLKVFNTTMMLPTDGGKTYSNNYNQRSETEQSRVLIEASLTHDPLLQFNWMSLLYKRRLIEVDDALKCILDLQEDEYMRRFRDAHAHVLLSDFRLGEAPVC